MTGPVKTSAVAARSISALARHEANAASESRIPASYTPAKWRSTLPQDPASGELGLAFDMPAGSIVRLRLSAADARHVIQTLAQALEQEGATVPGDLADAHADLMRAQAHDLQLRAQSLQRASSGATQPVSSSLSAK